jgi:hypothetical protein
MRELTLKEIKNLNHNDREMFIISRSELVSDDKIFGPCEALEYRVVAYILDPNTQEPKYLMRRKPLL